MRAGDVGRGDIETVMSARIGNIGAGRGMATGGGRSIGNRSGRSAGTKASILAADIGPYHESPGETDANEVVTRDAPVRLRLRCQTRAAPGTVQRDITEAAAAVAVPPRTATTSRSTGRRHDIVTRTRRSAGTVHRIRRAETRRETGTTGAVC